MKFKPNYLDGMRFIRHDINVIPVIFQPNIESLFSNAEGNTFAVTWTTPCLVLNEFANIPKDVIKLLGNKIIGFGGDVKIPTTAIEFEFSDHGYEIKFNVDSAQ